MAQTRAELPGLHLKFLEDEQPSYPEYLADAFYELKRQAELIDECHLALTAIHHCGSIREAEIISASALKKLTLQHGGESR